MKIFIITEGGRNIGFGHIGRCISLSQAFEERGITTEFIINADTSVLGLLKGRNYRIFDWLKEKEKLFSLLKDSSIAIADSYLAGLGFYKKISELAELAVYIDDNKRLDFPKGIVVNGGTHANEVDYPQKKEITYILGARYAPLKREFWRAPQKKIGKNIERLMITFGGDDKRNLTPKVLKFLNKEYPRLLKNVIISDGFSNIKEIKKLKRKKVNFISNPNTAKMKRTMLLSDIAISAGGQTLHELARVGVPSIGVAVAKNQSWHMKGLERIGFLEHAGWHSDKNLMKKIKNAVERLKSARLRKEKSETGRKFIDGNGSRRVIRAILSNYFRSRLRIREARLDDARNIFNLSNEEEVRANSFCPRKFGLEHHLKWFKEKLSDKTCVFFVLDVSDNFAGQLRFNLDFSKKEAIVDISLIRNMRHLGLSVFILEKSMNKLFGMNKDIRRVKAYIKEENAPSIRSFEKANFKFLKDTVVSGNKTKIYARERQ